MSIESMELTKPKEEMVQESAMTYLDTAGNGMINQEFVLPKPPAENSESAPQIHAEQQDNQDNSSKSDENDWMSRMEQNY